MADDFRNQGRFGSRSRQLGQLLVESGDITSDRLSRAVSAQEASHEMLGKILQREGCSEAAIAQALAKQIQVTDVRCESFTVPDVVYGLVSRDVCDTEKLCPFER